MNTHDISKENGGTGLYQIIRAFSSFTSNPNIIGNKLNLGNNYTYTDLSNEISDTVFLIDENNNFIVDDHGNFIII